MNEIKILLDIAAAYIANIKSKLSSFRLHWWSRLSHFLTDIIHWSGQPELHSYRRGDPHDPNYVITCPFFHLKGPSHWNRNPGLYRVTVSSITNKRLSMEPMDRHHVTCQDELYIMDDHHQIQGTVLQNINSACNWKLSVAKSTLQAPMSVCLSVSKTPQTA